MAEDAPQPAPSAFGGNVVAQAFCLVLLAGVCAPLGASVVCFMKRGHRTLLSLAIAGAAGVMIFVSLTEVLNESIHEIGMSGLPEPVVLLAAYGSFLLGILACWLLDLMTDVLLRLTRMSKDRSPSDAALAVSPRVPSGRMRDLPLPEAALPRTVLQQEAKAEQQRSGASNRDLESCSRVELPPGDTCTAGHLAAEKDLAEAGEQLIASPDLAPLLRTGVLITLALGFHNLPEGLATFVGYMAEPQLGITIAIAIAIHNIPEGIAIGVPMFYATGSRWQAIAWAAVSGVAEPLGALIGYGVWKAGLFSPMAIGIILGFVAGIMTGIAVRELIPRSMYYDPSNRCTTHGIVAGFAVMALSFVLLALM